MEELIAAWYSVLSGNVIVAGNTIPVYRADVATGDNGHCILLHKESGVPEWNKSIFLNTFVLIVEIKTRFSIIINDKLVDDIDKVVKGLVFTSTPGATNLNVTGLIKVNSGSPTWLGLDDNTGRTYRKITRFIHQVASETA